MYVAYQLTGCSPDAFSEHIAKGEQTERENNGKIRRSFDTFLTPSGTVDAAMMMDKWFTDIDADVFISHSRADKQLVWGIAGFLEAVGLKPFVDSSVWGHGNALLRNIDENCCKSGHNLFSYEKSTVTASHVHMMLATALTKMMDRCECVLFVRTGNSVATRGVSEMANGGENITHSPWLFHELSMLQLLRRKLKEVHREQVEVFAKQAKLESVESLPKFDYPIRLDGVPEIRQAQLKDLMLSGVSKYMPSLWETHPLDRLYRLVPPHDNVQKP